ncbi:MAG TPA: hypothetical protein VN018_09935, partial [Brevundimonas sp.]|nr:hypothetical protein [Brevundimonas sp.]
MLHHRPFVGRSTFRALFMASAAAAAIGGGILFATDVLAEPAAVTAPAPFVSDRLSVEVVGQGPDLILIPGFGCSREVWRVEAERLKATHRVHLVQLAGFAGEAWTHGD